MRRGKFGSRLLIKLAGIFGMLALVPGLMIYTVSYQFVSRSIETWFYVRVEGAFPLVGVGGIDSARAAFSKFEAGASLIQTAHRRAETN